MLSVSPVMMTMSVCQSKSNGSECQHVPCLQNAGRFPLRSKLALLCLCAGEFNHILQLNTLYIQVGRHGQSGCFHLENAISFLHLCFAKVSGGAFRSEG